MVYKGAQITIDLKKKVYKRLKDDVWRTLPTINSIVLTQIRAKQSSFYRVPVTYRFKVFCVFIKTDSLNILAYKGKRNKVENEAKRLSQLFNVSIIDLYERDEKGKIKDDDYETIFDRIGRYLIIMVIVLLFCLLTYVLIDSM